MHWLHTLHWLWLRCQRCRRQIALPALRCLRAGDASGALEGRRLSTARGAGQPMGSQRCGNRQLTTSQRRRVRRRPGAVRTRSERIGELAAGDRYERNLEMGGWGWPACRGTPSCVEQSACPFSSRRLLRAPREAVVMEKRGDEGLPVSGCGTRAGRGEPNPSTFAFSALRAHRRRRPPHLCSSLAARPR